MKRYLLDSNALNSYIFRRGAVHVRATERKNAGAAIGTGIPIVAEILGGTLFSDSWKTNVPIVERKLNLLRLWPFDLAAARKYAHLYAEMRRKGDRIQSIDLMIAAIALTLGNCTVVSSDSDLSRVPGLVVENWVS
jgi:tRNA(fMet)-specific endonuclease VapC